MRYSFFTCNRRTVARFRQAFAPSSGSIKIKLLLCCLTLIAFLFASHRSPYSPSPSPSQFVRISDRPSTPRKGYTLLINTWKRYDLLKKSISHYAACRDLDSIHIVWSEPDPPSESLTRFLENVLRSKSSGGTEIELKFDINREDSLNNRFKEINDSRTDAVFSIDDDIIFPCPSVEFAFNVWLSAPDTMVGFVPRVHWLDQSKANEAQYVYRGWWYVWWTGTYSMILSKAAFFHKKYLTFYTNEMPTSLKEYVSSSRNCEDIAMSFLVANATGSPPIWVKGKIYEIGSTGISTLGGHSEKRSECINRFVEEFGHMPLIPTNVKAVDSRTTWFW